MLPASSTHSRFPLPLLPPPLPLLSVTLLQPSQEDYYANTCSLSRAAVGLQEVRIAALFPGNMDAGNVMGRGPVSQLALWPRVAMCLCGERLVLGGIKSDADVMRQSVTALNSSVRRQGGRRRQGGCGWAQNWQQEHRVCPSTTSPPPSTCFFPLAHVGNPFPLPLHSFT